MNDTRDWTWWSLRGAVALKLLALVVLAVNSRLVMDEFWTLQQSFHVGRDTFTSVWPEKAVLYAAFFKLAALPGLGGAGQVLVARGLGAALAIALAGMVYATARALGQGKGQALVAVLVLLSFSTFLERGFRLRSEPLALLFAAMAAWIVLRYGTERTRALLVAGVLSGLAFVSTQKSVYFNVALGAGLVIDALASRAWGQALRRGGLLIAGWALALAAYALVFGGTSAPEVLRLTFLGPLKVAETAQDYYGNLRVFVLQTLLRNLPLYMACFAGLALMLARVRALSAPRRIHLIATLVITALVFAHNQPWPYVFTMALPFLAPYAGTLWPLAVTPSQRRLFLLLFAVAVALSFVRNVRYLALDNHAQLRLISTAEAELHPGDRYFDGIGMLPDHAMAPLVWLDAMNIAETWQAGEASALVEGFKAQPPVLVIASYRTQAVSGLLDPFLAAQYRRIGPNLWLRNDRAGDRPAWTGRQEPLFQDVYSY